MNERAIIASLKSNQLYRTVEGSFIRDITDMQQRAANLVGRLLVHAHKKGKRKKGRWI